MFQNNLWILSFLLKINTPARLTIEPPNGLQSAVFIPVETPVGDDSLAKEVILVDNDITDKDEHIVNKVDNLKERLSLSAKPNDWDQCEGVRQVAPAVRESIWNTVSVLAWTFYSNVYSGRGCPPPGMDINAEGLDIHAKGWISTPGHGHYTMPGGGCTCPSGLYNRLKSKGGAESTWIGLRLSQTVLWIVLMINL